VVVARVEEEVARYRGEALGFVVIDYTGQDGTGRDQNCWSVTDLQLEVDMVPRRVKRGRCLHDYGDTWRAIAL